MFQYLRVLLQLVLLLLDPAEHLIECVGQLPQLVFAERGRPHGIILPDRHGRRGIHEREDRCCDPPLEEGGQGIGGQHRDRQDNDGNDAGQPEGVCYGLRVRRDVESPQPFVRTLRHRCKSHKTAAFEAVSVRLRRCRDEIRGGSCRIGREHSPVPAIQRRGNHMRVVLQRSQNFRGVRFVRKRQGGGGVGGKNAGPRGQMDP